MQAIVLPHPLRVLFKAFRYCGIVLASDPVMQGYNTAPLATVSPIIKPSRVSGSVLLLLMHQLLNEVSAFTTEFEGISSLIIPYGGVSLMLEKNPNHLNMTTIGRAVQMRPAIIISYIWIYSTLQQELHNFGMTTPGRIVQRRTANIVSCVRIQAAVYY